MKLYAGNLPLNMTEDDLKSLFQAYGEVIAVNIVFNYDINQSKGFGFVQFENESDATEAIEQLNGSEIDGHCIKVSQAKPKKKENLRKSASKTNNRRAKTFKRRKKDLNVNSSQPAINSNRPPGSME